MSQKYENTGFVCARCGAEVPPLTNGGYRNHCPRCLWSLHVDDRLGDRASSCRGLMEPVRVIRHSKKGWQIVHRCVKCGAEKANMVAESTEMPDDIDLIVKIMKGTNL